MIHKLDENNLKDAAHWLAERDTTLDRVLRQYGYPPLWNREPGFSTLIHIMLEQQVSLASANAAFQRLQQRVGRLNPENLLSLDDESMRAIGFSRQKTGYARHLATEISAGRLDLDALQGRPEETLRTDLKRLKGIGDWTVDIYLSECLLYPDILPKGDIALLEAFRVLNGLDQRPVHDVFLEKTAHWRPWRSVGTRMLWHFYLSERRNKDGIPGKV